MGDGYLGHPPPVGEGYPGQPPPLGEGYLCHPPCLRLTHLSCLWLSVGAAPGLEGEMEVGGIGLMILELDLTWCWNGANNVK